MNKLRGIGILGVSIIVVGILGSLLILQRDEAEKIDVVAINSIVKTATKEWSNLEVLKETSFRYDYIILDASGTVLLKSKEIGIDTLEDAIKQRQSMMNIIENGKFLGTVVVLTYNGQSISNQKWKLIQIVIGVSMIQVLIFVLYGIKLYSQIIRPFEKLKEFAQQVARGNLDLPLKMDKYNAFGEFTESFDLMREELKTSKQKEYEANESKKQLIASLSHDIKTPVTGIKLISELLEIQVKQPEIKEKIHTIYSKAEQINELITGLFQVTLQDLGELKVDLKDEYASSLGEFFKRMDYEGVIRQGDIPECMIYIDAIRMEQIINNIIGNSYKYANTDIDIYYVCKAGYLQVEVKDYGKGVAEEDLPLICNKFYRGNEEWVTSQTGAGLGLYISKTLMEKMGGELECRNVEDGFVVRLLIPLSCAFLIE